MRARAGGASRPAIVRCCCRCGTQGRGWKFQALLRDDGATRLVQRDWDSATLGIGGPAMLERNAARYRCWYGVVSGGKTWRACGAVGRRRGGEQKVRERQSRVLVLTGVVERAGSVGGSWPEGAARNASAGTWRAFWARARAAAERSCAGITLIFFIK